MKPTNPKFTFVPPVFSWNIPIEQEMLTYLKHMERQNRSYISNTIWGNKQKREAECYANAFALARKHLEQEIAIRTPPPLAKHE
jgi:hypothetical protein